MSASVSPHPPPPAPQLAEPSGKTREPNDTVHVPVESGFVGAHRDDIPFF